MLKVASINKSTHLDVRWRSQYIHQRVCYILRVQLRGRFYQLPHNSGCQKVVDHVCFDQSGAQTLHLTIVAVIFGCHTYRHSDFAPDSP